MIKILDYPFLVFILTFVLLWLTVLAGAAFNKKLRPLQEAQRGMYSTVLTSTLTLLSLLLGFTMSMAVGRYDQRKNYEEAEANAIGTEYLRVDLLSAADATRLHALLKDYLDQRILFYTTRDDEHLRQIDATTSQLQSDLWSTVKANAATQSTAAASLTLSGMNDVLNSQGYTQAAWWYRIPFESWALMLCISVCCSFLLGYGENRITGYLYLVVPIAVSISFFLIADIDSPRQGMVAVHPQNLISLSQNLKSR
jgi:ABC-type uncharacterized transport system fused permease/ATPase subunit